jgi:hypothetical protein
MTQGETLIRTVEAPGALEVTYKFGGASKKSVPATKEGNSFSIKVNTISWAAGAYKYQAWAKFADDVNSVICEGTVDIEAELCVGDTRSTAKKNIDAIQAMLSNNATEGVKRYRINNRELERYDVKELLELLRYWTGIYNREMRKQNGFDGLGPRIAIRF